MIGGGLPVPEGDTRDEHWMKRALEVAAGAPAGDVPIGAVLVSPLGVELAVAANRRECDADPLGHAEMLVLRAASGKMGDAWRMTDCTLYVTVEPCAMCAGALVGARIGRIVFGAWEPKTGACGSVWDIPRESPLHRPEVRGGVLQEEAAALLREFFGALR